MCTILYHFNQLPSTGAKPRHTLLQRRPQGCKLVGERVSHAAELGAELGLHLHELQLVTSLINQRKNKATPGKSSWRNGLLTQKTVCFQHSQGHRSSKPLQTSSQRAPLHFHQHSLLANQASAAHTRVAQPASERARLPALRALGAFLLLAAAAGLRAPPPLDGKRALKYCS